MATFTIKTRKDEDSTPVETRLTIDFTGCTLAVLEEIATSAIVIKRQSRYRKHGIPATDTVKAVDCRPGMRHAALSPEEMFAALPPEQRAALFAKYDTEAQES